MELQEMKDSYDWREAFVYADHIRVAYNCKPDGFSMDDVAEITAASEGENDGPSWLMCGRLNDGRWFYLSAGCDYTGWDCQAGGDAQVADTLSNLKQYAMDNEGSAKRHDARAHARAGWEGVMGINFYHVELSDGTGIIKGGNVFEVNELNVLGENHRNIVVDDVDFTTIRKDKDKYYTCLDQPSICIYCNDNCWGNRVTYRLYTASTKKAATIRKEIEREIDKKIGFFRSGVDLSFIKDKP